MKRKRGLENENNQSRRNNDEKKDEQPKKKRRKDSPFLPAMMFSEVCQILIVLSRIDRDFKGKRKTIMRKKYYRDFIKKNKSRDLYPFIRLMVPQHDNERKNFGMKERKIAEIYGDVAMLSKDQKEDLKKYKLKMNGIDFADDVRSMLEKIGLNAENPMTVKEVNDWLTELYLMEKKSTENYIIKFREIIRRLTPDEHMIIVRVIMGEMKMGMNNMLLKEINPNAMQWYGMNSNLEALCKKFKERNNNRVGGGGVTIFGALKPMLAKKGHPSTLGKFIDATQKGLPYLAKL